jgi:hypothetical protein
VDTFQSVFADALGFPDFYALNGDAWHAPTPGTAEHLRKRLAPHGATSRPGRHGALLTLAGRLPAPILAERLGIQARAAQWVRAAGTRLQRVHRDPYRA